MTTKTCTGCHIEKHISHFGTKSSRPDSKETRCKSCFNKTQNDRRARLGRYPQRDPKEFEGFFVSQSEEPWQLKAACRDEPYETFFPDDQLPRKEYLDAIAPARKICESCPVRLQCLSFAVTTKQEHGIWGGKTQTGRKRYKKVASGGLR